MIPVVFCSGGGGVSVRAGQQPGPRAGAAHGGPVPLPRRRPDVWTRPGPRPAAPDHARLLPGRQRAHLLRVSGVSVGVSLGVSVVYEHSSKKLSAA